MTTRQLSLYLIMVFFMLRTVPASSEILFEEVSSAAGIDYMERSNGAAWGDFNRDGWPDIWAGSHSEVPRLYLNNKDGTFTSIDGLDQFRGDNHGSAWADFDNDGDQDLLELDGAVIGTGEDPNRFLINSDGMLTDESVNFGLDYPRSRGRTPLWLDWNGDGNLDVIATAFPGVGSRTALFTQENGSFVLEAAESGFQTSKPNSFAQLGWDDLAGKPLAMIHGNTYPDSIYRFDSGSFSDITPQYVFPVHTWETSDVVSADLNGDLLMDLLLVRNTNKSEAEAVGNYLRTRIRTSLDEKGVQFGSSSSIIVNTQPSWLIDPSQIFIGANGVNPDALQFTLLSNDSENHGIKAHSAGINKGVYVGYDPVGGNWQIFVSSAARWNLNFLVTSSQPIEDLTSIGFVSSDGALRDVLLLGTGALPKVVDATVGSGLGAPESCESAIAADFDNDMDLDLYLVCRNMTSNEPNLLFENIGGGFFEPVIYSGGASGSTLGRGESVTGGDYNLDGFIDLFVTNGSDTPPFNIGPYQLFENQGNGNYWLQFDLEGVESNRDGVGARLFLTAGGVKQIRIQDGGMHRVSQNHQRVHFGLGQNTKADELTVEWPSGKIQVIKNLPSNEIVQVMEPSYPTPLGRPSYVPGQDVGVYLWKDSFDGPYHLELNSNGSMVVFSVEVLSDKPLAGATPLKLEWDDTFAWNSNHLLLEGRVTTGIDGLDFQLAPGGRALLAITKDWKPNPRQLHVGASGAPLTPAGWVLEADTLPALPVFQRTDLGLFVGHVNGDVQARWNGDGATHQVELELLFSKPHISVTPVSFEQNDDVEIGANSVFIDSFVSTWWDGIDLELQAGTRMGLAYTQDHLFQPNRVNPADRNLGLPNAYRLPKVTPYGVPAYVPANEAKMFLWKDASTGHWHVQATAGGEIARFTGELVSDQPFISVMPNSLEAGDTLDTTDPMRIAFDLTMSGPWEDGFRFEVPPGASLQLDLYPLGNSDPATDLRVGADRWPVEQLPVNIGGW